MYSIELFNYYSEINGFWIEETDDKRIVAKLFRDDMLFWAKIYNMLETDLDYRFFISGVHEEKNEIVETTENTFLEFMNMIQDLNNWKNNRYNLEIPEISNHRLHKLLGDMEMPD